MIPKLPHQSTTKKWPTCCRMLHTQLCRPECSNHSLYSMMCMNHLQIPRLFLLKPRAQCATLSYVAFGNRELKATTIPCAILPPPQTRLGVLKGIAKLLKFVVYPPRMIKPSTYMENFKCKSRSTHFSFLAWKIINITLWNQQIYVSCGILHLTLEQSVYAMQHSWTRVVRVINWPGWALQTWAAPPQPGLDIFFKGGNRVSWLGITGKRFRGWKQSVVGVAHYAIHHYHTFFDRESSPSYSEFRICCLRSWSVLCPVCCFRGVHILQI